MPDNWPPEINDHWHRVKPDEFRKAQSLARGIEEALDPMLQEDSQPDLATACQGADTLLRLLREAIGHEARRMGALAEALRDLDAMTEVTPEAVVGVRLDRVLVVEGPYAGRLGTVRNMTEESAHVTLDTTGAQGAQVSIPLEYLRRAV